MRSRSSNCPVRSRPRGTPSCPAWYFKDGRAKAEIALARGKREFDKRQALREEQDKREALRAMRYKNMRSR